MLKTSIILISACLRLVIGNTFAMNISLKRSNIIVYPVKSCICVKLCIKLYHQ